MLRTAVLSLLVVMPRYIVAQGATPSEPVPNVSLAFGIHYGLPMRTSAAVGVLMDAGGKRNDGFIAMLEPGHQGNEISAGYFHSLGRFGSGYSLRVAVIRTKAEPWNATARTTYVGVEANGMLVLGVGGRVGFLRRASRSSSDPHDNVVSFGVSIGS